MRHIRGTQGNISFYYIRHPMDPKGIVPLLYFLPGGTFRLRVRLQNYNLLSLIEYSLRLSESQKPILDTTSILEYAPPGVRLRALKLHVDSLVHLPKDIPYVNCEKAVVIMVSHGMTATAYCIANTYYIHKPRVAAALLTLSHCRGLLIYNNDIFAKRIPNYAFYSFRRKPIRFSLKP